MSIQTKIILSDRLIIRRFTSNDFDDLYEYLSQEEVVRFEPYEIFTKANSIREAIIRSKNDAFWAVCLKENNKVIGNLYFERQQPDRINTWELGYVFNSFYWKCGYATEACSAFIKYAFNNLNTYRIVAMCNTLNASSWKLLERLGFRREGHLIKNMYFKKDINGNPIWSDTYEYALLSDEYFITK